MKQHLTLFELNSLVKSTIEVNMSSSYWVETELSECRERNGHCYLELIQKDEFGNTPIAKASAMIWRNRWLLIRPNFERNTQQSLHAGMKVLLQVTPNFHVAYGFSWIVNDIDPTYTLGDMARRRQEIIKKLKDNGIFELQKELEIPIFAQRIAIISSDNAAGYGDFCNQLHNSSGKFAFTTKLFRATMQGETVEKTVIAALNDIYADIDHFDVVVIIRGGGATSDLSGFDTYSLAENVTQFPIPVITGIGHERDDTILDLVACVRVKTPTAAAEFLIDNLQNTLDRITDAQQRIVDAVTQRLQIEKMRLDKIASSIPALFALAKTQQEAYINALSQRIINGVRHISESAAHHIEIINNRLTPAVEKNMMNSRHHLDLLEQQLATLDPALMLKRGYSITTYNGKVLHDPTALKKGDVIKTQLEKGTIKSTIK